MTWKLLDIDIETNCEICGELPESILDSRTRLAVNEETGEEKAVCYDCFDNLIEKQRANK
jgi:hypothetical protein